MERVNLMKNETVNNVRNDLVFLSCQELLQIYHNTSKRFGFSVSSSYNSYNDSYDDSYHDSYDDSYHDSYGED